jgi:oligopeptide/dipeptide ABC transporter ATP-binding protein
VTTQPVLAVEELSVAFRAPRGSRQVLSAVSFTIGPGEILGVVGESGSGKSVTAMAVMRLLGAQGLITGGAIRLEGEDIARLPEPAMRGIRGRRIAMIFQEPMTSLNPLLTVGFQIAEVLREKLGLRRAEASARAIALMQRVGIPGAAQRFSDYPHMLSGGMRQRIMIAIAMACDPRLLIADEPTTALDVTIQAQILDLVAELRDAQGAAVMLITHDMGVIARMAERVIVMYAGEVVEAAPICALFAQPAHPYTQLLMAAIPTVRRRTATLPAIPGTMPSPEHPPPGCRFHPRCPMAIERCRIEPPLLRPLASGHASRCHRAEEMLHGAALPIPAAAPCLATSP